MGTLTSIEAHKVGQALRQAMLLVNRAIIGEVVTLPFTAWELEQLRTQVSSNDVLFIDYLLTEVKSGQARLKHG